MIDPGSAQAAFDSIGHPAAIALDPTALPPSLLGLWTRPVEPPPNGAEPPDTLTAHFDLKRQFRLPAALITGYTVDARPSASGAVIGTTQSVREVGPTEHRRIGTGRSWTVEVAHHDQHGAPLGTEAFTAFGYDPARRVVKPLLRDSSRMWVPSSAGTKLPRDDKPEGDLVFTVEVTPTYVRAAATAHRVFQRVHHERQAARAVGVGDVFLDTPSLVSLFDRLATEARGPGTVVAAMELALRRPVVAGSWTRFALLAQDHDRLHAAATVDGRACATAQIRTATSRRS